MKHKLYGIILLCLAVTPPSIVRAQSDSPSLQYTIDKVVVDASAKQKFGASSSAVTSINPQRMRNESITAIRELSLLTPNLHIPDYGSKMTSTIYIRGIGARIDQPAMGLYVDDVPYMNKNNYDFDFFDITGVEILRGPQSTLYGRNTIGGVIHVHTLSPLDFDGLRIEGSYSSANTLKGKLSYYKKLSVDSGYSVAASYNRTDGYFTNEYDNTKADDGSEAAARCRVVFKPAERWQADNSLGIDMVNQGGFAYAPYDSETQTAQPVNHNAPCSYERLTLNEGLSLKHNGRGFKFSSVTSYCYTNDRMRLDQDFSPLSLFTLTQSQSEHSASQDFVFTSDNGSRWQWLAGAFAFYRHNAMSAPVDFMRDGIDDLILNNINNGIQTVFPDESMLFANNSFLIGSHFKIPTWGAALYHQSVFSLGALKFTAGLRLDYEHTSMKYDNSTSVDYRFTMTMEQYKRLTTELSGIEKLSYWELLPRLAADYDFGNIQLYMSAAKGYKAGGFNTQIFSDIVQNRMMNDMMSDMGIYFDGIGTATYDSASATSYKPEYSWNYELGSRMHSADGLISGDLALFYIDCRDQQLTVFPEGKNTGRMMSNAGRTRSYGVEVSMTYSVGRLNIYGNYGHTDARFREYRSGTSSYAGKYIPAVPQNTVSLSADYRIECRKLFDRIVVHADCRALGKIYWNEENSLWQDFYTQLGASVRFDMGQCSLTLWGQNLLDAEFNTFYFKSVGNSFVQRGKPCRTGLTLNINIL